ncbi:MAG TPA: tail fiber protein [Bacilli bacterium]|nr:tail fiber protein [Bacilli bacterium]
MSEPFLGEIRMFANNYAPRGWMLCEGQILNINQYQALYSLLGAVYGGNGVTTFALPDLRGRVPIHVSTTIPLGQKAGEATHTLTQNEMPAHTHQVFASTTTTTEVSPLNNTWGNQPNLYSTTPTTTMNNEAIGSSGGSQAHDNMQPYLSTNFAIAVQGIFPSRN